MRDFYESVYGSYQTPPSFQGQDHSKKRSSGSNGNVFGRFLKLGKSKSDAHGYNVKSRGKPTQQYDLEEDFRVTSTSKSPVERMVYKVNNRKDVSKSHSWIYGSVKLPSDLPFGYGHGYSPGNAGYPAESMHSSRCQTMEYCGMCECSSEFNFHPESSPHPHQAAIPFENNNCHGCHTPTYAVTECCKHSQVYNSQKQYAGNVDSGNKFANSVRKLTWKSLKQVVKKRPTLDVLKKSNTRIPSVPLNALKEEPVVCTHEAGLHRSNYFFPDKKSFYASCTDVYGDSPQHVTASVRVRPKRSRQPWPFPNEFGPVPNYQEEEIYHSEWDLRQFLPYDVWLAASNNPYLSPNSGTITTKNPKTNRHSSDPISPSALDDTAIPSTSSYPGEEAISTCSNYPTKIKSIGSGSTIYGSGHSSLTRSSILQTDVTAYQLIKSKKSLPNKNPLEVTSDDPTDSDELSDNVVSEDPVRIGGQGIYMISTVQTNPAMSPAKSPTSVHSQSNESNEKSQIKAIASNSRKSQEVIRADMSWKMEMRGSPQQQKMSPHSVKSVPTGSREREQTADKFNNKITEPNNDSSIYGISKPNNGNPASAKTGLKTYYSQPVASHGLQFGAGNTNVTNNNTTNAVQAKKFTSPRALMSEPSGSSYENQVSSNSNAKGENRQSYLAEFEAFEFQENIPNTNSTSYSSPSPSNEVAKSSQLEREGTRNIKTSNNSYNNSYNNSSSKNSSGTSRYDSSHQEPEDWGSIGENAAATYRPAGSAAQGEADPNGKKSGDNNRRGQADNNERWRGEVTGSGSCQSVGKRRKSRPGQGKTKTVLKETIYEEESENSDDWSVQPSKQQVYAVKIVVSQNVASEYVKPILKKDRVYETPSVDSRPGQGHPQLPHNTTGSGHTSSGSDLCGEGHANPAPTTTRPTKKVQFDSSRLVVLGGDVEHEDDSDNTSAKDSAEEKQDDWIVEEDFLSSNTPQNTQQQQNQEELQAQSSSITAERDFQEPSREYPAERRSNPTKTIKFSSVGFELPDTAAAYGKDSRSYGVSSAEYSSGHNTTTKTKEKLPESPVLRHSNDQQLKATEKNMHQDERLDRRAVAVQEDINVQQTINVTPVTSPSNQHRISTMPNRETAKVPAPALQQRVLNLNSLLFHDTTRIRLNQSRPSLEQAFNFNKAPLGADRNVQGPRDKFMPRLKQSSSFRQPGASLLRPKEPPPPPPIPLRDTSLPSYKDPKAPNSRKMNPTEMHKPSTYSMGRPAGKPGQQERYLTGITGQVSRQHGNLHIRKPSIGSGNSAQPLRPTNPAGLEIKNNLLSPTRTNPDNFRNAYEAPRINPKEASTSRSKSLADRCKSLEKLISQRSFRLSQEEKQPSSNDILRANVPKVQHLAPTPAVVRTPLPPVPTMAEPKTKDVKPSANSEEMKPNCVMNSGNSPAIPANSYHSNQYKYEGPRDPRNTCKTETHAIQGQVPSKSPSPLQKDSQDNAKYQHPEQNIEIVTKENSVSEIRIYSTPQNINVSHTNPPTETHSTYNPGRPKESAENKIEEMHYAATDLLYPRSQPSQKDDGNKFDETNGNNKSRPQSTSVVLIIAPKQSLPEEGMTETNASATNLQQHIYKRTDYEQKEKPSDLQSLHRPALVPSVAPTQATTKTVKEVHRSDLQQQQDKRRTDAKTANSNVTNTNSKNLTTVYASNLTSINSSKVESAHSSNVTTASANKGAPTISNKITSTTSNNVPSNTNAVISSDSNVAKSEKTETISEDIEEPLYDDVITYAARKAKRSAAEKRYSTFSAPQLFESLNKELTRNAATFTQNLLSKYSSKSLSSADLAQSQNPNPLPPPPIPALPPPKIIIGKIGSGSIKSRRSVSEYPYNTKAPSTTSTASSQQLYNDIENRDRGRFGSIRQLSNYKGSQKNANLIYDDTLSIISSNYGRSMVDGKVSGFMEGEFEDEEPLYDDVLNLLLPDSDSGVDTEDSPPPPLPSQGPPVHLSPRVSMELQALNFPPFPHNPIDKSMLRKSTENLQKILDGNLTALSNSAEGDAQKQYNLSLSQIRGEGRCEESHGDYKASHNVKDEGVARSSDPECTSRSGLANEDKVLDRTRTLLNELSEKLNKLNFASPEYQTYVSKVVVSSSPESSGVEEDYSSEKNCSLSNSSEATTGRLTAVSKLVTETISMARGKFLDSMKMNVNNSSGGPNLLTAKNNSGPGVVPQQSNDSIEELEEPIYEEIGDMKRPSSPIYADTFDVNSIFDGASRNEILSFLESLRDRLATAESASPFLC